jgi:hypothetical protein
LTRSSIIRGVQHPAAAAAAAAAARLGKQQAKQLPQHLQRVSWTLVLLHVTRKRGGAGGVQEEEESTPGR